MYATTTALLVLALLQGGQAGGELKFRPPDGWQHATADGGKIVLQPPGVPQGKTCFVLLLPASEGELAAALDQAWERTAAGVAGAGGRVVRRGTPADGESSGGFATRSVTAVMEGGGERTHVLIAGVQSGPKVRLAMYTANDQQVFNEHLAGVKSMLDSAFVSKAAAAAGTAAPAAPAAAGSERRPVRRPAGARQAGPGFEGVFYTTKVEFNPIGGRGERSITFDYMCFSKDGRVYWGKPIGGPVEVFENEYESQYFGEYTLDGTEFTIVWGNDGKPKARKLTHAGRRIPGGGVEVNGTQYRPIQGCDGMKLDGTYEWKTPAKDWSAIRFTRDGRFVERGLKHTVSDDELGRPDWPKLPESGSGTYSIRQNTLEVKYDGGPTRRIFFTTAADPKDPGTVSINSYPYERKK